MNELMSWDNLITYAGLVPAVAIITQFIKELGFIKKIPARIVSYVIAFVVMVVASLCTNTFTWQSFALTFINAVFISLAANGAYDACNAVIAPKNTDDTL